MTTQNIDETMLIRAVIDGADEYEHLVERYHVGLIIYCERIVTDRDDAEDIAQEAFVKAYLNLKNYDPQQARFSTWLYKIAANLAIDFLRKKRHQASLEDIEATAESNLPPLIEEAERQELRGLVSALMPPEYRQVIEGYYWHGKSYQELADELEVPLNTVRTWLRRAKQQLEGELS